MAAEPVRCHLYLRVSTPEQDMDRDADGKRVRRSVDDRERDVKRSLDTQEHEGRAYARERNWTVVAVYRETFTGTDYWARPELRRLREQIAAGAVDVMLCYKVDRFLREQTQLGVIMNLLAQHGARLDFVLERVDDTPTGKFMLQALAFAAELELESIKERFSRGKRARIEAGQALHGPRPAYGCDWADAAGTRYRLPAADAPERAVLRAAFLDVTGGASPKSVADRLTRQRVPAPAGGPTWYAQSLRLLLTNPLYCGQPVALRARTEARHQDGKRIRRTIYTPAGAGPALLPPEGEPVVSPAEFAACQEALRVAGERQAAKRGTRAPVQDGWPLLRGVAVCGVCEGPLVAHSVLGRPGPDGVRVRRAQYVCGANRFGEKRCAHPVAVYRETLERDVWMRLNDLVRQPAEVERLLRVYREAGGPSAAERARAAADRTAVRATLADLEGEADNLAEQIAVTPAGYARDVLARKLEEKGAQQAQLVADLAAAEAVLAAVDAELADIASFEGQARQLLDLLDRPDAAGRLFGLAVRLFRPRVVVPPANPADPSRPSLAAGPRVFAVTFPAAVPAAVREMLGAVSYGGSGSHQSWYPPLAHTAAPPPAGTLWLAVAPGGGLTLARA